MNLKTQIELFDQYTAQLRQLMQSKGADYGGADEIVSDRLSNFKIAASLTNQTPSQQALSLIATKVARLTALLANPGRTPNNESVKDSCLDGGLYFFLLAMVEHEAAQEREASKGYTEILRDDGMRVRIQNYAPDSPFMTDTEDTNRIAEEAPTTPKEDIISPW